jgi:hypothetical protein
MWWRDARGYRLAEPASPGEIHSMFPSLEEQFPVQPVILPESFDEPHLPDPHDWRYIVGNGGTPVPYRADEDLNRILFEFVNSPPHAEGALQFANRWGLLCRSRLEEEHQVPPRFNPARAFIRLAMVMNKVIDALAEPAAPILPRDLVEAFLGADGVTIGRLGAHMVFDRSIGAPRVRFTAGDLETALWLRLADAMESGLALRRCQHCGRLFAGGKGTGRRLVAHFCSDEHRILYHRLKNAPPPAPEPEPGQPRRRGRPRKAAAA